ncbi:hypothetical protein OTU49_003769 [Cherax quadricarinatus]|uniref:Uncharacterized protein n=1 Tax=Cherax quadricarinatus TaxID=27406 RepID=A0AAW0XG74_CHEQU
MCWHLATLSTIIIIQAVLPVNDGVEEKMFSNAVWNEATIFDFIEDDIFFEVLYPEELSYTYRLRQAKNFGIPFIYDSKNLVRSTRRHCYYQHPCQSNFSSFS